MVGLHEVPDDDLLARLKLEQFEQVLSETLHLCPVREGQQPLRAEAQDLQ